MSDIINISDINKISIRKKPNNAIVNKTKCNHRQIEVNESLNVIICDECKKEINPIWWLARVADEEKFYKWSVDEYEKRYNEISKSRRHI